MFEEFIKRVMNGHISDDDTEIYAYVSREIANDLVDQGLWTKACVESGDTGEKAKLTYIRLRVDQIKRILRQEQANRSKSRITEGLASAKNSFNSSRIKNKISRLDIEINKKSLKLREKNAQLKDTFVSYEKSEETRASIRKQMTYVITVYLLLSIFGYFTWGEGAHIEKLEQSLFTLGVFFVPVLLLQEIYISKNSEQRLSEKIDNQKTDNDTLNKELESLKREKQILINELNTLTR